MIENIVSNISNYLYTYILIILLVGGGLLFRYEQSLCSSDCSGNNCVQ